MEWLNTVLTVLALFTLRLAIPIIVTALAAHFLRKLDAHWQVEYEGQHQPPKGSKPECWKIKGCKPEQRETCPASLSSQPCWQVFRQQDGRLKEECLSCEVFLKSPTPPKA
jgi:hypothetical protein